MPVTGKYAPWRLWILILFWTLQFLFLILTLASSIYSLAKSEGSRVPAFIGIGLVIITLAFTVIETVQCGKLVLKPRFYLVSNIIKCAIWIGICIISIVGVATSPTIESKGLTIVYYVPMMLIFIIPVIYGSIVYHQAKRDAMIYKMNEDAMYTTGTAFGTEAQEHNQYELGVDYDAATSAVTPRTHQYDNEVELKHYPGV